VIALAPHVPPRATLRVLCLGAHADDLEIGCGGTILRLLAERARVDVTWVVACGAGTDREREARRSAAQFLRGAARRTVRVEGFRDAYLPWDGAGLKDLFEDLKAVRPHLVFTHARHDAHQDHRLMAELTWNTFRDHAILEYEVPKFDGDLGQPGVFVPLPPAVRRRKVRLLMAHFRSQRGKRWYTASTFEALMRLRGIECGAPEGYAEAFYGRKLLLAPGAAAR